MRVLIVDDEPDILLMLRLTLETDGYVTVLAGDGRAALARIDAEPIDIVLLDLMMPVMDGWSVLEALGARTGAPRVIVLSARSTDADIARAFRLGAADYVVKPFGVERLGPLIEEVRSWSDDELDRHRAAWLARVGG